MEDNTVKVDVIVGKDINNISAEITNPAVIESIVQRLYPTAPVAEQVAVNDAAPGAEQVAVTARKGGKPQTRKRRHQKKGGRKSNTSKRQRKSKKSVRRR